MSYCFTKLEWHHYVEGNEKNDLQAKSSVGDQWLLTWSKATTLSSIYNNYSIYIQYSIHIVIYNDYIFNKHILNTYMYIQYLYKVLLSTFIT